MSLKIETEWLPNWYGIWASEDSDRKRPTMKSAINPDWCPEDKRRMVAYLNQCPMVMASGASGRHCDLCGVPIALGFRSDSDWVWANTLAHLVDDHSVVLPNRFVEHIRQADYSPPVSIDTPTELLPWPEGFAFLKTQDHSPFPKVSPRRNPYEKKI